MKENNTIEILDAMMGSGKTTAIINWMKKNPGEKFMYVSPLLTEVEDRIPTECASLHFVAPNTEEHDTKADHLLSLLEEGVNVSFTHSLFESLTKEHLRVINNQGYVLIIDEEIDFIEPYQGKDYSRDDILTLEKSGHVYIDEDNLGTVIWTWDEEQFEGGNYNKLKSMCDLQMIHCAKRDRSMMVVHLPASLITSAKRVIVMTYLFENSVMARFMEMKGFAVKAFTDVELMHTEAFLKKRAADKIQIVNTNSMQKVRNYNLSSTWYSKSATKEQLKKVENAIYSVCRLAKRKEDVMYTYPKELHLNSGKNKKQIRVPGFHTSDQDEYWIYCGTKATNKYAHKKVLIHAFNRYPMLAVTIYLQDYGFPINDDEYALSELLQWVWRSGIREGEEIKIAFLAPRMRRIFEAWFDGNDSKLKTGNCYME